MIKKNLEKAVKDLKSEYEIDAKLSLKKFIDSSEQNLKEIKDVMNGNKLAALLLGKEFVIEYTPETNISKMIKEKLQSVTDDTITETTQVNKNKNILLGDLLRNTTSIDEKANKKIKQEIIQEIKQGSYLIKVINGKQQ